MTQHTIAPLPGFDWQKVNWGGPDEPRTEVCSYCGDALDHEHPVPLILWDRRGWTAEFCDHCQATWWGMRWDDTVEPQHEPEVRRAAAERMAQREVDAIVRTCRVCGCTDERACPGGCYWVAEDLCSVCAVGKPGMPGYWANEVTGRLLPVVTAFLTGEPMTCEQVALQRAYFRQWIVTPGFVGPGVDKLRARIDGLTSRAALDAWWQDSIEEGVDPL